MAHAVERNQAARASRAPRRPRHVVLGIVCGYVVAYSAGVAAVVIVNNPELTGYRDHLITYLVGLPMLVGIAGAVFGAMISVLSYVEEVDAPVREDSEAGSIVVVDDDLPPASSGRDCPPRSR